MRGVGCGIAATLVAGLLAGCATAPTRTDLPAFPLPGATSAAPGGGPVDVGVVPDDCGRMLAPADLGAVLGLPLGSVTVKTVAGVPAPSVGRTERLDCAYTVAPAGAPLLAIRAAAYADPAAARAQWTLNAKVEDGTKRDVPIGAASSVLVERPGEALLTVVYGTGTLTLTLADRPLPGGKSRGDVLVDLALRVLPSMAKAAPTAAPAPSPTTIPDTPAARAAGVS